MTTTTTPKAQPMSRKRIGRLPQPFVKWAGGKRQLVSSIELKIPKHFRNYYEPFVGGGALFFHIHNSGRLGDLTSTKRENKVVLNDKNGDLIAAYRAIRDRVDDLIDELRKRRYENSQKRFHKMRDWEPATQVERAARLIYLNKTCYNGLWRVNSQGKFNTPYARNERKAIFNESNLHTVSRALKGVTIYNWDYMKVTKRAGEGDLIYLDPPYFTERKTGFTKYTSRGFTDDDHSKLADECARLHERGCKVLVSNTDHPLIENRFKDLGFASIRLAAKRMINCKPSGRTGGHELLFWNM